MIQSYRPEHHAIQAAAQHDYAAFYAREMAFRREHLYPPVRRLARLVFWEKNEQKAKRESERMAAILRTRAQHKWSRSLASLTSWGRRRLSLNVFAVPIDGKSC